MKPNRILMSALCALIVSGCATTNERTSARNKELLRRFYDEVFIHWNLAVVDEMVAPQFRSHDWPDDHSSGPQGFRDFYGWLRSAFPDLRYTVEDMVAQGDRVVVRWRQDATHKGEFLGVAATGRPMTMNGIAIYRVAAGKLAERWVVVDLDGLLKQLRRSTPAAGGEPVPTVERLQASKELLHRAHAEVWSQGNLATADELYAPDYVCHFIAGSEWKGVEGLKAEVRRHRTSFPDWHEHIEQIVAEGDFVVTRFTCTGTQRGVLHGRPPTGKAVKVPEVAVHRIANGKIAEQWGFPDVLTLNQQLDAATPGAENKLTATDARSVTHADFIGTWRLVSFEAKAAGQTTFPFGREAQGPLVYTPAGRVAAVISRPDRERFAGNDMGRGTPEEKAAAFDSCLSYFGTFEVKSNAVIHRIEHCTFPNWIGTEQSRVFQFDGNRLMLQPPPIQADGGQTVLQLVWERLAL